MTWITEGTHYHYVGSERGIEREIVSVYEDTVVTKATEGAHEGVHCWEARRDIASAYEGGYIEIVE